MNIKFSPLSEGFKPLNYHLKQYPKHTKELEPLKDLKDDFFGWHQSSGLRSGFLFESSKLSLRSLKL